MLFSMYTRKFISRINYLNPEIFKTSKEKHPLLTVYREESFRPTEAKLHGEPYFTFEYISKDVKSEKYDAHMSKYDNAVKKTNYFFIALGSDNENILMANKLREILGNSHLSSKELFRTVISYVVFDSSLCEALNRECFYSYTIDKEGKKRKDIYMKAIGSTESIYSTRNVFLTEFHSDAQEMHEKYYTVASVANRKEFSKSISKDTYTYASSIARRVHRKYKVFSAGMWEQSIFDLCEEIERKENEEKEKQKELEKNRKHGKSKAHSIAHFLCYFKKFFQKKFEDQ